MTKARMSEITELVHKWMAKRVIGFIEQMKQDEAKGDMELGDSVEKSVEEFMTSWGFIYHHDERELVTELGVTNDELFDWMHDKAIKPRHQQKSEVALTAFAKKLGWMPKK